MSLCSYPSFPVDGVGTIREDGGESECAESAEGLELEARLPFFAPAVLEVPDSWI